MFKITNPYSRGRYTLKDKLYRVFTKMVIPIILRLPKINLRFISILKLQLKHNMKNRSRSVVPPNGVGINFLGITASELVPMENINDFRAGMKRLLKIFRPKNFFSTNSPERIDSFCDTVEVNIHGRSWHNLGTMGFDKNSSLGNFIQLAHISASHISSSLIVVHFELYPSDEFKSEIDTLIKKEMQDDLTFKPKLKTFFKMWGTHSFSAVTHKQQRIEDLILELKWRFLSEINKHFKMHFYENDQPAPSIEVYKLDQTECALSKENNHAFYKSVGLGHSDFNDISIDGVWKLHYKERDRIDNSLKISCNSLMPMTLGNDLEGEILHRVSFFATHALPILVIRSFTNGLSKKIASYRNSIFKSIQKNKKYAKILKQRFELERDLQILSRIKSEYEDEDFKWAKVEMVEEFVQLTPSDTRFQKYTWIDSIVDMTSRLINETFKHSNAISKIFDDYLQLRTVEINLKLQKRTIRLTVITVVLTVITIVLAIIALYLTYFQIMMSQKNFGDLINGLKVFFK